MKPLAQNTMIQGRYLIVQLIGKGGMGEVYLAVDQRLGSAVALKRTYFAGDETLGSAFEREARILARMRHPVLPKVSDHFGEGDEQYLVMEHISGDDLSKRLEVAQKPFPLSWVMFWADQLLDALSYLHSHEPPIIHRDIKPQNLKLTDENHIILLDFGLSKSSTGNTVVPDSGGTSGSTTGGSTASVVGYTPHYAPMEQIRGIGTSPRSDIYSLSATLYQLLSNTVPFDALTRADDLINVGTDPIRPLHEVAPEVPVPVSDVIMRGMELSQEKRYGTAKEMQKELRRGYASLQNAMSEQTVAFTTDVIEVEPEPESSVNMDKTEVMNFGTLTEDASQPLAGDPIPVHETPAVPDYDATVAFSSDAANSEPRQADVKTEVFIPGSFNVSSEPGMEPDEYKPAETPPVDNEPSVPAWDATFAASGLETPAADAGESFSPEATVPLMSFDQGAASGDQGFQQTAASEDIFTSPGGFDQGGSDSTPIYGSEPDEQESQAVAAAAASTSATAAVKPPVKQKKKGSTGKIIGIFAGLFAIFLLAGGGIAGGWYYYTNYYLPGQIPAGEESPTPTPFESPTPEPTIESGIDDGNSNTESDSNTNTDSNSNTEEAEPSPTPSPAATPRQESTPRRETTPRPTPRTTPRQTPAPTPRSTPRRGPVILQ
ncbi:MAG: protein kinase [Acidobacteria bacterium]|nr:protein kinase [Acidobacteriota bacterium]